MSSRAGNTRWILPGSRPDGVHELARALGVSRLLAELLLRRGFEEPAAARAFLKPNLNDLHDPALLPDMDVASSRIHRAICEREKIVIYGDYDVDGVSATVLMVRFLRMVGADVTYRVPDRMAEGYGLNLAAVRQIAAEGTRVLITVDNGTSSYEEIALARELGLCVIVTDHHEPGPERVPADAIVNPKRADSRYPAADLCGVGVAFKTAWAVARRFSAERRVSPELRTFLLESLALVALGTVADVVPLRGENRVLVSHGLTALTNSQSPGLRALIEVSGLGAARLKAADVGYRLGPRINAAGRLTSASVAIDLLLTDSYRAALEIAKKLNDENHSRQEVERGIHERVRARVRGECLPREGEGSAIVLWDDDWHPGVIGIVASRLVDEFRRPTMLVAMNGETGRGSGRSIKGYDLFEALTSCPELMIGFGGHSYAAGLEIARERLPELRTALDERARRILDPEDLIPEMRVDVLVSLADLTVPAVSELRLLAPHGEGNPSPRLAATDLRVAGAMRRVGRDGSHLSMHVSDGGPARRAIAFGAGEREDEIREAGNRLSIVFTPGINDWNGQEQVELVVKDIRVNGADAPA